MANFETNTQWSPCRDNDQRSPKRDYESLGLKMFEYREHKLHDMDSDIDPENHFYNNINNQCEYYTEAQIKGNMQGTISIIHFNCRSMKANFSKIKQCLSQLENHFTALAILAWLEERQDNLQYII